MKCYRNGNFAGLRLHMEKINDEAEENPDEYRMTFNRNSE